MCRTHCAANAPLSHHTAALTSGRVLLNAVRGSLNVSEFYLTLSPAKDKRLPGVTSDPVPDAEVAGGTSPVVSLAVTSGWQAPFSLG